MKIDPRNVYPLKGKVQHYAWGGYDFIPALLAIDNTARQPFAEYWMGAHDAAPAEVITDNAALPLPEVLTTQPALLGQTTLSKFGQLPYLLKVLDVKEMLSIQVHPTREEAIKGFEAEEAKGIAVTAASRNYKDKNHKPEVMIALSDFWLLHGFQPEETLRQTLQRVTPLQSLLPLFESGGYEGLYRHVMEMPQAAADALLVPIVEEALRKKQSLSLSRNDPDFWVAEYYQEKPLTNIDRGIFSIYFFNLVHLLPGQAIFQAAGVPHAYLFGQNIELMANSDNVLRAGLTPKHIDITELMKHTRFEATHPAILHGEENGTEQLFRFPVDDFLLGHIQIGADSVFEHTATSPEIILCTSGHCTVTAANTLEVTSGAVCIAFAGTTYRLQSTKGAVLFRAAVP